jgi:hypothetical protein
VLHAHCRAKEASKEDRMMRRGVAFAAALSALHAIGAQAGALCGYAAREKATIKCGYSTAAECKSAIGKGAMCVVDPDYASNVKRAVPATTISALVAKLGANNKTAFQFGCCKTLSDGNAAECAHLDDP